MAKIILICLKCGAKYPLEHSQKWGHTAASDGYGAEPRCTALIDAPHAPKAKDPNTNEQNIVARERCGGLLSSQSAPDNESVLPIEVYGAAAIKGPLGVPGAGKATLP